jgi:hypothetical protein
VPGSLGRAAEAWLEAHEAEFRPATLEELGEAIDILRAKKAGSIPNGIPPRALFSAYHLALDDVPWRLLRAALKAAMRREWRPDPAEFRQLCYDTPEGRAFERARAVAAARRVPDAAEAPAPPPEPPRPPPTPEEIERAGETVRALLAQLSAAPDLAPAPVAGERPPASAAHRRRVLEETHARPKIPLPGEERDAAE